MPIAEIQTEGERRRRERERDKRLTGIKDAQHSAQCNFFHIFLLTNLSSVSMPVHNIQHKPSAQVVTQPIPCTRRRQTEKEEGKEKETSD